MMWGNGAGMGWWMWLVMGGGALGFWVVTVSYTHLDVYKRQRSDSIRRRVSSMPSSLLAIVLNAAARVSSSVPEAMVGTRVE